MKNNLVYFIIMVRKESIPNPSGLFQIRRKARFPIVFLFKKHSSWLERKVRDSCGKSVSMGDPAGQRRGGSRTARGKRVPGVEIND